MMFRRMLVMLLVRSTESQEISILSFGQEFNPLMDKNIMNKKISHTVQHDAQSDIEQIIKLF